MAINGKRKGKLSHVSFSIMLPPSDLSPNARVHWRKKADTVAWYRSTACMLARQVLHGQEPPQWIAVRCQAVFFFKTRRRRDGDNLLTSLKSAFDGLADAGIVADDCGITHLPVVQKRDAERPRVELWIEVDREPVPFRLPPDVEAIP